MTEETKTVAEAHDAQVAQAAAKAEELQNATKSEAPAQEPQGKELTFKILPLCVH